MFKNAGVLVVGYGALMAGCSAVEEPATPAQVDSEAHALEVYRQVEDAAGGELRFGLTTVERGRVRDVRERSVGEWLGVPAHRLVLDEAGTEITAVRELARDSGDEWARPVRLATFDELGRDTSAATYRVLAVSVQRDAGTRVHRALQVCWTAEDCLLLDPVLERAEGFAADRARLLAEGWKIESHSNGLSGDVRTQAACTLSSNWSATSRTLTWPARTITYKNLYGITVATHRLGGQQTGISCYVSGGACLAGTFGYANASSCDANFGFNCDCDYTGDQAGTTNANARAWAETKCEHKNVFQGTANVSWTKDGIGANFNITWSTSGGTVNSNGGTVYDTCAWH